MKTKTKEKIEDIIARTSHWYVNSDITTEHFPIPDKIQTENWEIVPIDKTLSSQEVLDLMKSKGLRPANIYELALWSEKHRQEVPKGKWYIALGQSWAGPDGYHRVPIVFADAGGDFRFGLGGLGRVWSDDYAFFGFRDSTLGTQTLTQPSDSFDSFALENAIKIVKAAGLEVYKKM